MIIYFQTTLYHVHIYIISILSLAVAAAARSKKSRSAISANSWKGNESVKAFSPFSTYFYFFILFYSRRSLTRPLRVKTTKYNRRLDLYFLYTNIKDSLRACIQHSITYTIYAAQFLYEKMYIDKHYRYKTICINAYFKYLIYLTCADGFWNGLLTKSPYYIYINSNSYLYNLIDLQYLSHHKSIY
jgi:hypothetical protein